MTREGLTGFPQLQVRVKSVEVPGAWAGRASRLMTRCPVAVRADRCLDSRVEDANIYCLCRVHVYRANRSANVHFAAITVFLQTPKENKTTALSPPPPPKKKKKKKVSRKRKEKKVGGFAATK